VVQSKLATYAELDTSLGIMDLHDLLEIHAVQLYNQQQIDEFKSRP